MLSQIDEKPALVLIDLQKGIAGHVDSAAVVANAKKLAGAFRAKGHTVVLVNVDAGAPGRNDVGHSGAARPAGWDELLPELTEDAIDSDIRVTKHCWGAFTGSDLHEQLQARGVTQIILGGISTSVGVETTGRSAYGLGYNVVFAADAMTDSDLENHEHSIKKIFPKMGEVSDTVAIVAAL